MSNFQEAFGPFSGGKLKSIGIVCTSPGFGGLELNTLKLAAALEGYGWKVRLLVNEESPMHREAGAYLADIATVQQYGRRKLTPQVLKNWLKPVPAGTLFTPFNKDIKALSVYKRFYSRKLKLVYQQQMKVGVAKRDLIHSLRYRMLDLWISPLPYLKEETMRLTRVPGNRITVIPLGVDVKPILGTRVTRQSARITMALPQDAHILGVIGRIDPKKGQDFAIRALGRLHRDFNRRDHLLIMGNITLNEGNDYHNLLHRLVREHGLEPYVHFRPYHADVNLCYQAIDIFLMPSLGETFGMVTLEAMLSGKPVIGVNREGTAALLQQGRLGLLHEPGDIEGFCRQLFFAEASPAIPEMLDRAREEVLARYTLDQVISETDHVLSELQ